MNTNSDKLISLETINNIETVAVSQQTNFLANAVEIDIDKLVGEISGLVSIPEIYIKIRELSNDLDSTLDDFAVVVNTDPALIVAVLKIVNSAFFGFTGKIDNISRALNLIGIGQLHDLVLSLSTIEALDLPNDMENLRNFWQRSIYCGVLSKLLAKKLLLKDAENLFVVGLLHQIGRLILFLKYPEESKQAILYTQKVNLSLTEVEKLAFGLDYSQVGQALMSQWNLPVKFQIITGYHTEPDNAPEYKIETLIVHIAHMVAANKFPGPDNYQYVIDDALLAKLKLNEEDMSDLSVSVNEISREMENLILGR